MLAGTGADLLGVNEAYRFTALLRDVPGYQTVQPGTTFELNNAVLVRDGITVLGSEARQMCDAVNAVAARSATLVRYVKDGQERVHISTHLNSHIQLAGGTPRDLPRVKEAIRHMIRLEEWVKSLQAEGVPVTVSGDFNWSWSFNDDHDWTYSPEAVFGRLGMVSEFDVPSSVGPTLGNRKIDYIYADPNDVQLVEQALVPGEHSDHQWVKATFRRVEGAA